MPLTPDKIQSIIKVHSAKSKKEREQWDRYRAWYSGEYWGTSSELPQGAEPDSDEGDLNFQTNYPYAYVDTMVANVCPPNPQITAEARREELQPYAKFREALANDTFKRTGLHRILWRTATTAAICQRGFTKTVWNQQRQTPDIFHVDPRHVWFDMSAQRWEDIRYIVEVSVLTVDEFRARSTPTEEQPGTVYDPEVAKHANPSGYPAWLRDTVGPKTDNASREAFQWITVFEVYDFEGNRYYHVLDQVPEPLFEGEMPYAHVRNPFSMLVFNDNLRDLGGLSDVKLIESHQARLNEIDTLELVHAHTSIPITMVNEAMCDNPEEVKTQYSEATSPGSIVGLQGKNNAPIRDIIGSTETARLSPSFDIMRSRCTEGIEFTLGIPQYMRGGVGNTDVATEVALADTAVRTRNGRRVVVMNDIVEDIAAKVIGLYEEFLPEDTELPIRLGGSHETLTVTREAMKAQKTADPNRAVDYDYTAVAYSPTENSKQIQLAKLQNYMEILMVSPAVSQDKLIRKLVGLLGLDEILASPEELQQAQMQAQAAQMGGAPPGAPAAPPGAETDTPQGGALPVGEGVSQGPMGGLVGGAGNPGGAV